MSENRLGVGIIGASGFFGKDWYLAGFKTVADAKVVAVSARDRKRLDALDTDANRYTNYHDLLADRSVDLVAISTPDAMHHEQVLAAAAAGKHVLCEKPLALNSTQAHEMVAAVEHAGKCGFINFTYRAVPTIQVIADLIRSGRIGEVQHVRADVSWGDGLHHRKGSPPWRSQSENSGAQGILGDAGPHALDLVSWLFGTPSRLVCQMRTLVPDRYSEGTIDNADICLMQGELSGGATFASYLSRVADGPARFLILHILGSEGTIEVSMDDPSRVRLLRGSTASDIPVPTIPTNSPAIVFFDRARDASLAAITRAVLSGDQAAWLATLADGLRVQQLIEAAMQSAQDRRWVDIQL